MTLLSPDSDAAAEDRSVSSGDPQFLELEQEVAFGQVAQTNYVQATLDFGIVLFVAAAEQVPHTLSFADVEIGIDLCEELVCTRRVHVVCSVIR